MILTITDIDGPIELTFEDLIKYHGTRSICGLTVGYTALRVVWQKLSPNAPVNRDLTSIVTAFPGPGARDAFEMVTRAVSREQYEVATNFTHGPMIAEAAKGAYWFKFTIDQNSIEIGLKPDMVPKDFVPLRRLLLAGNAQPEDAKKFRSIQHDFSKKLLATDPFDAFNILLPNMSDRG